MKSTNLCNRLLFPFLFGCTILFTGCYGDITAIKDLKAVQTLLAPLYVMNDTFKLEHADEQRNHRENTYKSNTDIFKKIIYIYEYDVESGVDKFSKAKSYVRQLKENGEDARIFDENGKEFVVVYSTHIESGYTILAISKFYDNGPHKVLQNEYCIVLSAKQNNQQSIHKIINDFMKTDKINIRRIIIKQDSYMTDIRSY